MSLPWLSDPRRPLTSPREIPKLEAWFDALDPVTMLTGAGATITDGGSVALWADKSGNSGTLCYVSGTAASNSVSSPNKSVTGNQTFTLDVGLDDYTPGSDLTVVSKLSGNDGFAILILTTGVVRLRVGDGASVTNVDSSAAFTMTDLRRHTIGIAWTDGVGASFTQDGAAVGTAVAAAKTLTNAAVACTIGTITGRIYRVQIGSVYDFNPAGTTVKKLTNGDTLTTGGDVWTLASTGATGGRIAGERDLFQGANRPVYLAYSGTKYGYLNGTAGNYFSTPDSAAVSVTGDIDVRACLALPSWTVISAASGIVTKIGSVGQRAYQFYINTNGTLGFGTTGDGSSITNATSSVATAFSANEIGWVRATRASATGAVLFYTSADGSSWTQLGTPASNTAGAIFDGSNEIQIGASSSVSPLSGRIYRAQIYNGIGGTLVADFNPALYTSGTTFTASTGEVWTINGGAHIVTRTGLYFDGSNDYLKSAAFSLSQPETVYLVGEQVSWTSGDALMDGVTANSGQLEQRTGSPRVEQYAGAFGANTSSWPVKTIVIVRSVFNGASSSLAVNRLAVSKGNAGSNNMNGVVVGSVSAGSISWSNLFVSEIPIYSAAHDTATQNRMALYSGRKWGFAS